jgi:hypothetical protein
MITRISLDRNLQVRTLAQLLSREASVGAVGLSMS